MAEKKRRLNLLVNDVVNDRLQSIMSSTEAESITEVIRRALAIYDLLLTENNQNGADVILRFPNGKEKNLVLL